jgi:hypothetical protein
MKTVLEEVSRAGPFKTLLPLLENEIKDGVWLERSKIARAFVKVKRPLVDESRYFRAVDDEIRATPCAMTPRWTSRTRVLHATGRRMPSV